MLLPGTVRSDGMCKQHYAPRIPHEGGSSTEPVHCFLSLKTLNSIFVKLCLKLYSVSFQLFGEFIHRMVETIHFLPVVLQSQCPMRSTVGPFDIQAPTKALEYDKHLLRKLYMS